jgi:hypothetical protein
MYLPEECPVDGIPKSLWEPLCHEEKQFFCKNRGKMTAIMQCSSDSVKVYSEVLTYVAQFMQRDEVKVRLRALACGLLPIGKRAFVNVKRLKCILPFFGPRLVKDSNLVDDR